MTYPTSISHPRPTDQDPDGPGPDVVDDRRRTQNNRGDPPPVAAAHRRRCARWTIRCQSAHIASARATVGVPPPSSAHLLVSMAIKHTCSGRPWMPASARGQVHADRWVTAGGSHVRRRGPATALLALTDRLRSTGPGPDAWRRPRRKHLVPIGLARCERPLLKPGAPAVRVKPEHPQVTPRPAPRRAVRDEHPHDRGPGVPRHDVARHRELLVRPDTLGLPEPRDRLQALDGSGPGRGTIRRVCL